MERKEHPGREGLGDRVARLRRAKGWNQKELGTRVGLTAAQISKYERGTYIPRADVLSRLGEALEVSTDYLLTGRSPDQPRRDVRLRARIEALEVLPESQRENLISFLDSLLAAHQMMRRHLESRQEQASHARRATVKRRTKG